jgi:hypothetical protein
MSCSLSEDDERQCMPLTRHNPFQIEVGVLGCVLDDHAPSSPCAKLCHAHPVEIHNVFEISARV